VIEVFSIKIDFIQKIKNKKQIFSHFVEVCKNIFIQARPWVNTYPEMEEQQDSRESPISGDRY
jgi:hypothetical protein